ncbi:hypothetical protein ACQJBY_041371 [Aegilops geniculata]
MQAQADAEDRISHGQLVVLLRRGLLNLNPRLLSASPRPEGDICRAGDQCSGGRICRAGFVDEERLVQVCSEATSGWTRRIMKAPAEHELNPTRKSALELSMRVFITKRDGNVVNPAVGTSFDSLDEAYQSYQLSSSWTHSQESAILRYIAHGLFICSSSRLSSTNTWNKWQLTCLDWDNSMQKSKFLGFRRLDLHGLSYLQEEMASHNVNGGVSFGYICLEFSYNMEKMLKVATPVPFSDFAK